MKRKFDFGKIDANGTGRKANAVTVEMEYREKENGEKVFSVIGSVWNTRRTDIIIGGQCLDEIARYINSPVFKKIYRLWTLYHLNDMHPECEHQAAQGWRDRAKEKVTIYHFSLTSDAIREKHKVRERIINAAGNGDTVKATAAEQLLLSLEYSRTSETEILPENIAGFYRLDKTEIKACGWLHKKEHSRGILGEPCPVCGYKYGNGWKYFPIPQEDEKIIMELLEGETV